MPSNVSPYWLKISYYYYKLPSHYYESLRLNWTKPKTVFNTSIYSIGFLSETRDSWFKVKFSQNPFITAFTQIVLLTLTVLKWHHTPQLQDRTEALPTSSKVIQLLLQCFWKHASFDRREKKQRWPASFLRRKPEKKCFISTPWQIRGVVRFTSPLCLLFFFFFTSPRFPSLSPAATIKLKGKIINVALQNRSWMVTIEEIVSGDTAKPLIYFGEQ